MIASLLGILVGFILLMLGVIVGVYPEGDQTVGLLIMFGGLAQIIYSIGVCNE